MASDAVWWPTEPAASRGSVAALTVSYNTRELTALLLWSLRTIVSWPELEIVVVDNGSRDGSAQLLAEAGRNGVCTLLANHGNRRHGPGLNQGISYLASRAGPRPEWIWILDSDVVAARPDALSAAVATAREHSAALVGEPQHDQWHPGGRFGMYSLLIDPAVAWQERTGPFAAGGDPSLGLLASAARLGILMAPFPFTAAGHVIHRGRGSLAAVHAAGDRSHPDYEWAEDHHAPHFAGVPGADYRYRALLREFRQETGPLTGTTLAAACHRADAPLATGIRLPWRGEDRTLPGMSAPPAEGARVAWRDVPESVRTAIEGVCGAAVIEARTQPGGFSPGLAARVRCADGSRWFVKASSAGLNPVTPRMHRQEAMVLADLDPLILSGTLPAPRLRGTAEHGPWFALVVEDVDGRQPAVPWRDHELDLVLAALDRLAEALTPAPAAVMSTAPAIAEYLGAEFSGWRALARTGGDDRLDPWSRARLAELAALEATWAAHAAGDTLLHADIRADNLLLDGAGAASDRVMVVDWPHACRGAAFVDLVGFAPSVAMQGGPEPAELLARSRAGRNVSRESLAAVVCALAGYFTERSLQPPPPGLPTLRRFQAAQGEVTRRWLAALL